MNAGVRARASAVSTQNCTFNVITPSCGPPPRCPPSETIPDHGAQFGSGPQEASCEGGLSLNQERFPQVPRL